MATSTTAPDRRGPATLGFISASAVELPWPGMSYLPAGMRVTVTGMNVLGHDDDELRRAGTEFDRAVRCLAADGATGVLANVVPLSAAWGFAAERDRLATLAEALGIVVHTATSAIVAACHQARIERVGLVTAYADRTNQRLADYLAPAGIEVVAARGLRASGPGQSRTLTPDAFTEQALDLLQAASDRCDALVVGSRGAVQDTVDALAAETGLPVLHGTSTGTRVVVELLASPTTDEALRETRTNP